MKAKDQNMSMRLRKSIYGPAYNAKSGSITTKNKGNLYFKQRSGSNSKRFLSNKIERSKNGRKTLNNFRSSSTYKFKKLQSTKQPLKPNDDKMDAMPENEGSSFKKSFVSNHKNTPQEAKLTKSPSSYISKRHLSIQIDLYPLSEAKKIERLQREALKHSWNTEVKAQKEKSKRIEEMKRSKYEKSQSKNWANFNRFEQKASNYTQQVVINESSIEKIQYTDDDNQDTVRKHLNFHQSSDEEKMEEMDDENTHPNMPPLKTDRTVREGNGKSSYNKIPLG
jgi:hypothetical protein